MPLNDDNSHKYALNDEPICPNCDSVIKISEHEFWELLDENGPHEIECPFCNKEIRVYSSATWTFDTSEQDDPDDEIIDDATRYALGGM